MNSANPPDDPAPEPEKKPEPEKPEPTPEPDYRTWASADGKYTVEARLVKIISGKVTLKRKDTGKEITLPVEKLSPADQAFLKDKTRGK